MFQLGADGHVHQEDGNAAFLSPVEQVMQAAQVSAADLVFQQGPEPGRDASVTAQAIEAAISGFRMGRISVFSLQGGRVARQSTRLARRLGKGSRPELVSMVGSAQAEGIAVAPQLPPTWDLAFDEVPYDP